MCLMVKTICSLVLYFYFITRVLMVVGFENKDFFYFLEWTYSVTGIEGNLVELPCNLSTIKNEDGVKLVLWFKNGSNRPIYT